MPKKHPIVAAIEQRIEDRNAEVLQIETQVFLLQDRRKALVELQEEDVRLLAASTPKKARTKKEVAKDGANTGD